jgi:hypothetical protein
LPGINGSAVALSLKQTPVHPMPFFVSMTGDAGSQGDFDWLFDVWLLKPFSSEARMQVIEDARCSSNANALQATQAHSSRSPINLPSHGRSPPVPSLARFFTSRVAMYAGRDPSSSKEGRTAERLAPGDGVVSARHYPWRGKYVGIVRKRC